MSKLQFFWGNTDPEDMRIMGLAILFAFFANSCILFSCADLIQASAPAIDADLKLPVMRGILLVTVGWCFCYFSAMGAQIRTKMLRSDEADATHLAERALYNNIEHGFPSLLIIWMAGIYCNAAAATVFGGVYVFARFLYPILYGWYGHFTLLVEFSTQLGYIALSVLFVSLLGQLFLNDPLIASFADQWTVPLWLIAGYFFFGFVQLNLAGWFIYYPLYAKGLDWKARFDQQEQSEE